MMDSKRVRDFVTVRRTLTDLVEVLIGTLQTLGDPKRLRDSARPLVRF